MKKLLLTSTLSILTSCVLLAQLGAWTNRANFQGQGRTAAVGFSIGAYGYVGTGYTGSPSNDFWRYDPVANTWTQMAVFGGAARFAAAGFAIGNYGYIGTGISGATYYKDFWRYDVAGNSWLQMADVGGSTRCYAFGFSSGYSGYIGAGADGSVAHNDVWRYNVGTNTWTSRANFGTNRMNSFAFYVNGKGFVGCGKNFSGSTYYNDFFQYDSTANAWTARAAFPGSIREGVGAFVIGTNGYAGTGGYNNFVSLYTDFYKYDPVGNAWSAVATFNGAARANAATFSVGNLGYLGTGYTTAYTVTHHQFDRCSVTLSVTPTAPSCNGGNNGSINLTVTGATNPLTYAWSNSSTVQDPTGLSAAIYTITVTDGVGCTKTSTVTVTQPTTLAVSGSSTNATCNALCNGTTTASASGATPPYTYSWAPGGGTTSTATGLCAGQYTATVTDSKGCTSVSSTSVSQPLVLTASISITPATCQTCPDGSAAATISGGTPGYTYAWSPGGQTSQTATGLMTGTYTICVTDANGCSLCDVATVPYNVGINEVNAENILITPNPSDNGCFSVYGLPPRSELIVYNCLGEIIHRSFANGKNDLLNISEMKNGVYFLKIKHNEAVLTKKLILNR